MKLFLFVFALSALFSGCNSNPNGTAGKKDTIVIRDTVTALSNHSHGHAARKDKQYESSAASSQSANNAGNTPDASQPATANQPVTASQPVSTAQPTANAPQQENPQKKGWSAAAKDATIGGAAGAAAGALLDKNSRWVGGILGAAIGSGAGYLIGRSRDRKTGRVVKHKPSDANYNYASQ